MADAETVEPMDTTAGESMESDAAPEVTESAPEVTTESTEPEVKSEVDEPANVDEVVDGGLSLDSGTVEDDVAQTTGMDPPALAELTVDQEESEPVKDLTPNEPVKEVTPSEPVVMDEADDDIDTSKPSTTSIDHLTSTTDDPVQVDSQDVLELDYDEDGLIEQDEDNRSNSNKNRGEGLTTDKGTWKNLWISGLDQMMKANDLKAAFEPFGKVESGKIVLINKNETKKCFGFVRMAKIEGAQAVMDNLNGKEIKGRLVHIEKMQNDPTLKNHSPTEGSGEQKNDQDKGEEKMIDDTKSDTSRQSSEASRKRKMSVEDARQKIEEKRRRESRSSRDRSSQKEMDVMSTRLTEARRSERRIKECLTRDRQALRKLKDDERRARGEQMELRNTIKRHKESYERLKREQSKVKEEKVKLDKEVQREQQKLDEDRRGLTEDRAALGMLKTKMRKLEDEKKREREEKERTDRRERDRTAREREEREKLEKERRQLEEDKRRYAQERDRLERERQQYKKGGSRQSQSSSSRSYGASGDYHRADSTTDRPVSRTPIYDQRQQPITTDSRRDTTTTTTTTDRSSSSATMVRGLKVTVDLNLAAVSCPGTILQTRGYVFLELQIFKSILRSEFQPAIFPLLLHKKLSCSQVFPHIVDPGKLAGALNKQIIAIRLMQETGLGDQILAQYTCNAREFLFPTPQLTEAYPGVERQVLLTRTSIYTGLLEPKVEFGSKTTIKEVSARPKHAKTDEKLAVRLRSPSPTRSRGQFEMSTADDRLTRKTALNLAKAKTVLEKEQTFRRSRSAKRKSDDPRYMKSTVSFRAKSPMRRAKSAKPKKPLPFLTGRDDTNLARYAIESTDIVPQEEPVPIVDDANTYEKIRHRITRLLKSPSAQEVNRHGELDAALIRLDRKIQNQSPRVRLSDDASWSKSASRYRGEGYRDTFDASMREIYDDMIPSYE